MKLKTKLKKLIRTVDNSRFCYTIRLLIYKFKMTKRVQAKHKISRRLGVNLWGSHKYRQEKSHPPGQHGPMNSMRRKTDYGVHLNAKQKLKGYYGDLTEKQFRKIFNIADKEKGDTGEKLVGLLERRLDAVVYRSKFVPTIFAARQFVNHGHVMVNGKKVNIPAFSVKEGDIIEVIDRSKEMALIVEALALKERDVPEYIEVDFKKMTAKFVRIPELSDVPYPALMEPNLVVEYYAKN